MHIGGLIVTHLHVAQSLGLAASRAPKAGGLTPPPDALWERGAGPSGNKFQEKDQWAQGS